ncbi:unnamed protein product [Calypogeia fissa]
MASRVVCPVLAVPSRRSSQRRLRQFPSVCLVGSLAGGGAGRFGWVPDEREKEENVDVSGERVFELPSVPWSWTLAPGRYPAIHPSIHGMLPVLVYTSSMAAAHGRFSSFTERAII